jgi:hypothetical protein
LVAENAGEKLGSPYGFFSLVFIQICFIELILPVFKKKTVFCRYLVSKNLTSLTSRMAFQYLISLTKIREFLVNGVELITF